MNTFLIYILESTICISVFYLLFRLLMRKETSFAVNRTFLLTIVVASVIVPLVQLPQLLQTNLHVELIPEFAENKIQIQNLPITENATSFEVQPSVSESTPVTNGFTIPLETLLRYFYLAGVLVALMLFIRNVILIFLLSRKAIVRQMNGYRLLIVNHEVPSLAFGRSVIISQADYDAHGSAILAHEQAHIRLNHFVDLMLFELIRTIHWFNPAVYALIGDMKEIHEFQADQQTLHSGIDATQYQLLVIQKGVGPRRFALANSFNHCQIKKRITMMNKQKTSKAWRWKVATFLPMLALLLMAFGNKSEKVPSLHGLLRTEINTDQQDKLKQWTEADFNPISQKEIEKLFLVGKKKHMCILMNFNSEIFNGKIKCQMTDLPDEIRRYRDFNIAEYKSQFRNVTVNGKECMASTMPIIINKAVATNAGDFQKLLNTVGNTIIEIRGKYANEIFGETYQRLDLNQRNEIDQLVPFNVFIAPPKQIAPPVTEAKEIHSKSKGQNVNPLKVDSGLLIEIRKDGYYIDNKMCSLEETKQKVEWWKKNNVNGITSIKTEEDVPMSQVTKIKELLRNLSIKHINYSMRKPSKIVDEYPQFPGGQLAFREWIAQNIKYPKIALESRIEGKVYVKFIVNTNGKVENPTVVSGIDPALDAEALRVVSQMPKWEPAQKEGVHVSADYTVPITFSLQ